jgi:hypothetical protein
MLGRRMSVPPEYSIKRILLHGQWVEMKVYPPRPAPPPEVTAQPTRGAGSLCVDETATATPSNRRGRKNTTP